MTPDDPRLSLELRALFQQKRDGFRWGVQRAIEEYHLSVTVNDMVDILTEETQKLKTLLEKWNG
jgi:hypothetical protein